jgi:hypothetical protein
MNNVCIISAVFLCVFIVVARIHYVRLRCEHQRRLDAALSEFFGDEQVPDEIKKPLVLRPGDIWHVREHESKEVHRVQIISARQNTVCIKRLDLSGVTYFQRVDAIDWYYNETERLAQQRST